VVDGRSFIPIRQMAALVRHALAAVCTVPVLLVSSLFASSQLLSRSSPRDGHAHLSSAIELS